MLTSIDLSSAVHANVANCPQSDRHRVVRCDINALPFAAGTFDLVICLGVIQHTPDPESTIARLFRQVRPGGWLVIDHYSPSLKYYTKFGALALRPMIKRLPRPTSLKVTAALVKVFLPFHRAARHHWLAQAAVSRVSPVLTYYRAHPELNDEHQYEWALLDTHDSLTDYYKRFRTVGQIEETLRRLGAVDIDVSKGGNGVEARCRREH
jgi:SAM-dependent methyltransferase